MKKNYLIRICIIVTLIFMFSVEFISCKKVHNKSSDAGNKLVRLIWSKNYKSDSSGSSSIGVDSFTYDNQKRIIKVKAISYDTVFSTDTNGNPLSGLINTQATTVISYTSNNNLPDHFTESFITNGRVTESRTCYLYYNNAEQLIKDSTSTNIITHFTYPSGLIILLTNFGTTSSYSIDSIYLDGDNDTTGIFGSNFFLDSNNNPIYGRESYYTNTYSNILNPLYSNTSLSVLSLAQSNAIITKLMPLILKGENYSEGQNGIIITKFIHQYQYVVDTNDFLQSSVDLINGDLKKWYYY